MRFQEWLALPKCDRVPASQEMLAREMGVHMSTLSKWKRLDGWQEAVNAKVRSTLGERLNEVYGALLREAERGSFPHIKLILEMTGDYRERPEHSGEITLRVVYGTDNPSTETA